MPAFASFSVKIDLHRFIMPSYQKICKNKLPEQDGKGSLSEGGHEIEVEAAEGNYSLGFRVDSSSLQVYDYVVEEDELYLVLYSSDDVYLERASFLGSSQDLGLLISEGSYARVNLTLPDSFEDGDYFQGDVLFDYVLRGEEETYLRHLEGTVSYW